MLGIHIILIQIFISVRTICHRYLMKIYKPMEKRAGVPEMI